MNITTIGRGAVGGGLARLWRDAGHHVTLLGREGGDASDADVLLIAVPGHAIADAMRGVAGVRGKVAIDATNVLPDHRGAFPSYAHQVRSFTGAPTAKAFNMNFGRLLGAVAEQRVRPSSWYVADEGARSVTERLTLDAGYEPVHLGDLSRARDLENSVWLLMSVEPVGGVFYRFARPGEL